MRRPRSDLQYHDSGAHGRRVAEHLAKIAVQCDERSAFVLAHLKQCFVRHPTQPLTDNRNSIVAGSADQIGRVPTEILVELEFHAAFSAETGMICSRAASAP